MPDEANARPAGTAQRDEELIDAAVAWLAERLPETWSVSRSRRSVTGDAGSGPRTLDGAIDVQDGRSVFTTLGVEARRDISPRDVEQLFSGLAGTYRALASHIPVLVVAPWLSRRTQERLIAQGVNYLDLTGNALIRLENPTLFLRSAGSERNPEPSPPRGPARLRGPRAGRLIRLLADVSPPYGLQELTAATGLTPGYVSRLLETLDRELLIARDPRGPVREVAVTALLRHWAQTYDLFRSNGTSLFVSQDGGRAALQRLASATRSGRIAVTGSFAAVRHAPVAAPALLAVYCEDVQAAADALGLLPAETGGNVALLEPFDPVVWERTERDGRLRYAAASQVAVDCLTGNGRMPAEGEALLAWMETHEAAWRAESLVPRSRPGRRS